MNVFELFAKLKLDKSEYDSALADAEDSGERTASRMGQVAATAGKAIGSVLAAGAAAVVGIAVSGIKKAAEFEQVLGGTEAVFGDYAAGIKAKATEAYSSMGVAASDYMQTAVNIGSLLQGSGFGMEESAAKAEEVMQRAADVASIRGMDVADAMNAIAGAAKGNFTMMDNLGVAINETTLKNYALEKGIRGSYSAMTQAEKVGLAYDLFLEKSAYAAGNYARENETLSGSFSTMKAAWTNFLSGAGDASAVVSAVKNTISVVVKRIPEFLPQIVDGIAELITGLSPELPGIIEKLTPTIMQGALTLIGALAQATPDLVRAVSAMLESVASNAPEFIGTVADLAVDLIEGLLDPEVIEELVVAASDVIEKVIAGVAKANFEHNPYLAIFREPFEYLEGVSDSAHYNKSYVSTQNEASAVMSGAYSSTIIINGSGQNAEEVAEEVERRQEFEYRRRRISR